MVWKYSDWVWSRKTGATTRRPGATPETFHGTGGSNGDLLLTVDPGTRLQSGNASAQNMVIASVEGQVSAEIATRRAVKSGQATTPMNDVFDAYCTDFEKDNRRPTPNSNWGKLIPFSPASFARVAP